MRIDIRSHKKGTFVCEVGHVALTFWFKNPNGRTSAWVGVMSAFTGFVSLTYFLLIFDVSVCFLRSKHCWSCHVSSSTINRFSIICLVRDRTGDRVRQLVESMAPSIIDKGRGGRIQMPVTQF